MDFFEICTREAKGDKGTLEVYPDFKVGRSKDLMVRGRSFYAIWDEDNNRWSTDEYDVQRFVDRALKERAEQLTLQGSKCSVKYLNSFGTNGWSQFRKFLQNISDNAHQLDEELTFANTDTKKTDYVSRNLSYSLAPGDTSAWDELVGTLYTPEERAKIEWAIGAVLSGDSKKIQKFLVFYGSAGTGKSTILNIIQKLFDGYYVSFEAKALAGNNNAFSTEVFRSNPLVAIQHDGDLSKIEDNSKINSIISHEEMTFNEKYKPSYTSRVNAFLFMGTNKPVKISDAKSGIIRRLIDVQPTGLRFQPNHYYTLMARIDFELGAVAHRCLEVYRALGKNHYNTYRPLEMMLQTDVFYNYIEGHFDIFKAQDGVSLKQAYALYKAWCADTGIEHVLPQYKVREELRNYFEEFSERKLVDGVNMSSYYSGFKLEPFRMKTKDDEVYSLVLDETISLLDYELAEQPAQLAKADGTPRERWAMVKTTLSEIDTAEVHYVKVPTNHIVIDFDLKDDDGGKSLERNLAAASEWPPTYAELSKSGAGVHLHYIFTGGEPTTIDSRYSGGIEIKVFTGDSSLRRRLSRCNNIPISELASGLPFKEKKVLSSEVIKTEKGLRDLIGRNLRKEIHPGTKPSIDFIDHILQKAYESGMAYDVSDLKNRLIIFANNSTNQRFECLKTVQHMKFTSEQPHEQELPEPAKDARIVFFDVEVFPNLFVVCWKFQGDSEVVRMINPTGAQIEQLFGFKLVGFNNKRYDNHIMWARYLGYSLEALHKLSQKIIDGHVGSTFGEARNLSFTDIYDFASEKMGLKKWEIRLGIHHMELDLPWDQPVPESRWKEVADYCANDVVATEVVFEDRKQDFVAREILAELSGLTVNDSTQNHTAKIIFGDNRTKHRNFVYTDLAKQFPGYVYERGKSTYRDEVVGEGGYVYAEPGMYQNVALLDIASMHPTSIELLNLFGDYTSKFSELKQARMAIKRKEYKRAATLLEGKLGKFLGTDEQSAALAFALKIVINIVYGLTSAKFDNPFRDPRNKDNIVAKRGALFMIDLKYAVQEQGFTVAHIKTDSIKIPDATPEIIDFVKLFGEKYGYEFEHEATYDQLCLVNDAVYIARKDAKYTAVGAQFQHPYVFKTLFTKEKVTFDDLCETKSVTQGAIYLDFDHDTPMVLADGRLHFVGRTGRFVPVKEGVGGGVLYRVKDERYYAISGSKGHLWLEADLAKGLPEDKIDMLYFKRLAEEAEDAIDYFGPFADFIK